jgi:hypothetical protein
MKAPSFTHLPFGSLIGRDGLMLWIREHLDKCEIKGSYYEFGVLNGESIEQSYFILRESVNKYVGFDSFEGLSPLSVRDERALSYQPNFCEGNFKSMGCDAVRKHVLSCGMPDDKLILIEGFLEKSLTPQLRETLTASAGPASVVHLDVDLYSSTIAALEFIYEFLQTGTWLLCDDYWTYRGSSACGTQRALRDFLKRHPDILIQEYCSYRGWSKAFIVERCSED